MIENGVIVAENDCLMRSVVRSVLMRAELLVFPAANGQEAVALARQFVARLVLLDVAMPLMNGVLAAEAIRALPSYERVPIVLLTAYDNEHVRAAARRLGVAEFITKPFRPGELLSRLAPHIDLPRGLVSPRVVTENGLPTAGAQVWPSQTDPRMMRGQAGRGKLPAFVWEAPQEAPPNETEPLALADGREMMRIFRALDRLG